MIDSIKKLLSDHHPFILVLYLTAFAVAITLFFNFGRELSGLDQTSRQHYETASTSNAWDLPPFSLMDTDGTVHSLDDWKGKVILLNFWATWCPPCKYEIPDFMEYQQEYGANGLQIIGIGIDDPQKIREYYDAMGINYPVLISTASNIMNDWGNQEQVLPYSVVIDRSGQIRYIHRGLLDRTIFDARIRPLLTQ